MLRKILCAFVVLAFTLGIASAETLKGRIVKIADSKLTFQQYDKKEKVGEPKEYTIDAKVKVDQMVKKDKVDVEGGLKSSLLSKLPDDGLRAHIEVTDGKVTEITVQGKKK